MKLVSVLSSLVVGGLVIAPLPAAAQTVAAYKPAGQWALDYGDDYCRLARNFSNGNDQLAVAVERIEPGPSGRLIVISNGIHPYRTAKKALNPCSWHRRRAILPYLWGNLTPDGEGDIAAQWHRHTASWLGLITTLSLDYRW